MPGAKPEHVMHAALIHSDGLLMGSDDPSGDGGPRLGISVSYTAPDIETGRKAFEAIVEGGEVQMPFESTFWSPGFGGGVDRWGVSWMVRSEEHTSELQSLMRNSYAVFCLKKKQHKT